MNTSARRRRIVFLAAAAVTTATAGVAVATPPTGLAPQILARGTSAETLSVNEPRTVTVMTKVRVKTRRGKFVTRRVPRRQVVSRPIVACAADRQCDFVFQTITFQPGGHTGWHSHPGVLLVTVESGAVTRYEHDCQRNTYAAGQSFVERGAQHVILVRNEGTTPARLQIAYVVPAGLANAALRIDQPAPAGCNP